MALVRYPPYDRQYDGENGTEKVEAFVDTSTGQIFNNQRQGNSDDGFTYRMTPTDRSWDYMNTTDASGKNIFGSQGYAPEEYKSYGDESGDSWGATGKEGVTPSGDIQIGQSLGAKGYADVLNKYGIQPKYDPDYGYVLPSNVHNAVTQEYFRNYGLGEYGSRGGITGFLDNYAVPLMMAATGAGMAGLGGFAAEGAAATEGALATAAPVADTVATAETAAAAGDAYLPGVLSNPLTQAMPTVSNLAQAAATNAGMQLATTGTIDPEKVLESVVTGAAGSTLGNLAGIAAGNALDSNLVRSVVSGAVSGATQAAINGTDPVTAALASGAASGLGYEARENNINVPQQSINAVVNSIATGAPLEKTLLSAAMSIGVGAAKDAVSNISLTNTQAPAPVETRTPISPLPADSGNVTTAELSDTSPSGYVIAGTEVPANADGSIYSGLSAIYNGTNVAASNLPINTETPPEGYFDGEGAFRQLYQQADGSLKNESGDTVNQQGDIIKTPSRGFWGTVNYGNAQPTGSNVAVTDAVAQTPIVVDNGDGTFTTTNVDGTTTTTGTKTAAVDAGTTTNTADINANVVAAVDAGTTTDVTAGTTGLISTDNFLDPSLPGFRYPVTQEEIAAYISYGSQNNPSFIAITGGEAQSGDVLLGNDDEILEGTENNNTSTVASAPEENIANTGALSSIDVSNINNNTSTVADTKTAVGFNDYSDLVYQTVNGIFVDSSNNPVSEPSTKLDGTPFNDTRSLTGSDAGNTTVNPVDSGLSTVVAGNSAGSILDSSAGSAVVTNGAVDQGRTGDNAVFYDEEGNALDSSGNPVYGLHQDVLTDPVSGSATTTTVTPAVTTTVGGGSTGSGLPTSTGSTAAAKKDAAATRASDMAPTYAYLQPTMLTTGKAGSSMPLFTGLDPKLASILSRAKGGSIHPNLQRVLSDRGYNPVEMVAGPEDRYYARHAKRGFAVNGPGTGQSDDIPTMLADGEYVFDADTVAALGDGSTKAGAAALDKMREEIRKHKRSAPVDKIPPKARSPLDYLARKGK